MEVVNKSIYLKPRLQSLIHVTIWIQIFIWQYPFTCNLPKVIIQAKKAGWWGKLNMGSAQRLSPEIPYIHKAFSFIGRSGTGSHGVISETDTLCTKDICPILFITRSPEWQLCSLLPEMQGSEWKQINKLWNEKFSRRSGWRIVPSAEWRRVFW
jgi:hypothetical protein